MINRRLGTVRTRAAFSLFVAAMVTLSVTPSPAAGAASDGPVKFLGLLPRSPWDPVGASIDGTSSFVVATDPEKDHLHMIYLRKDVATWHLLTYDDSGALPRPIRDIEIPFGSLPTEWLPLSPNYVTTDTRRSRLLISYVSQTGSAITSLDLKTGRVVDEWTVHEEFPSFRLEGITYSHEDDRVYIIGENVLIDALEQGGPRPQAVTSALALDAGSGHRVWAYPLAACQQPLNTFAHGALIVRSQKSQALYVPCAQTDAAPRSSGITKIALGPNGGRADQAAAAQFQTEFFPISGRYQSQGGGGGIQATAAYDAKSDRIFLNSLSPITPGVWVFQGQQSAWVGFIALPAPLNYIAVKERDGRLYASGVGGPMLVTSGRGTPVPQGSIADQRSTLYIFPDEGSTRVYVRWNLRDMGLSTRPTDFRWVALEDTTALEAPLREPNYDALTHDIEETDDTETTFAGGVTGFGSRLSWVGGWSGLIRQTPRISLAETIRSAGTPSSLGGFSINDLGLHPRDRGIFMARVASLDVRGAGSSASAQTVAPDSATEDEWESRRSTIEGLCRKTTSRMGAPDDGCEGMPDETLVAAASNVPHWPWPSVTCLDAGGAASEEPSTHTDQTGRAEVRCSLADRETIASSFSGELSLTSEGGGPTIQIASSRFDGRAARDDQRGAISHAIAEANGVRITTPDGSVSIGHVLHEVTVSAHGRPDTTKVDAHRRLVGIVIRPEEGEPQRIAECVDDGCADVLGQINRALGELVRVEMPEAEVTTTKRGAFAGFRKEPGRYINDLVTNNDDTKAVPALQLTAYADSEQKSRLILQAAAIEATSIYMISPGFEFIDEGGVDDHGLDSEAPGGVIPPVVDPGAVSGSGGEDSSTLVPRSFGDIVQGISALLIRSPGQALQFASVLLLLVGAIASAVRRRSIASSLAEGGTAT